MQSLHISSDPLEDPFGGAEKYVTGEPIDLDGVPTFTKIRRHYHRANDIAWMRGTTNVPAQNTETRIVDNK